jgi:hypothetical protein
MQKKKFKKHWGLKVYIKDKRVAIKKIATLFYYFIIKGIVSYITK